MSGRFDGRCFKNQVNGKTLALIAGKSQENAFVQVVTDSRALSVDC